MSNKSNQVHGVDNNADLAPGLIHRETRPLRYRIDSFLAESGGFLLIMGGVFVTIWPLFDLPMIYDFLSIGGIFAYFKIRRSGMPYAFKRPHLPGDKDPGTGISFLGNEIDTGAGVYFSNDDVRTHMLVFGSTGSGKTRFLLGLLYQSLMMGSGCLYVDGKADNTVFWLVFSMCRRMGEKMTF
jgi:intracellular multiplication protein IcmO